MADKDSKVPDIAKNAILVKSVNDDDLIKNAAICRGHDFNKHPSSDLDSLMRDYLTTGFQATNVGLAIDEINKMLHWKGVDEKGNPAKCTIFFGYTSNMVSCGMREVIRYLAQHRLVDCIVTTTGAIEEDFMKCMAPHYIGEFNLDGAKLREKGLNRIGNLLVPNDNYCLFEDWFAPILDQCLKEQKEKGTIWSPSTLIDRMGASINNPDSVYYWTHKNHIPVFCPALTDGAVGDNIFFHTFRNPGFILDIVSDIKAINSIAMNAKQTGMIILGGGIIKHHICNANLMRNGADFTVYINTAQEFDGSDAGARPEEAISWGKIKPGTRPVKVYAEATLVFPLIVSQTFAKVVEEREKEAKAAQAK